MSNKILVIDDDITVLEIFEIISLTQKDLIIFTASDYETAKEIVNQNIISLIIIDIVLPGTCGYQIYKLLSQQPNSQNAYYIFMSAEKNKLENRLKGYTEGAHDFIIKPFDIKEIEMKLKSKIKFINNLKSCDSKTI